MSCILHIETSTEVCSVSVSQDGTSIFSKEDFKGPSHAVVLGVFVDEALSFIDNHAIPLDAVAVSCGPGSYTGLRIGVSMAKGICYGRNIPLIGIPTPEVMAVPVLLFEDLPEDALLCPMIDARRMEVIVAKTAGFCFGVKRAVEKVYANADKEHVYTYGPIIHNEQVVADLEKRGVKVVDEDADLSKQQAYRNRAFLSLFRE